MEEKPQSDKPDVTPSGAVSELKKALGRLPKRPDKIRSDRNSKKEDAKVFGEAARKEQTKQVVHHLAIGLLWIGAFCFYAVLVVRVLHYVLPTSHCWLTAEQLQGIDKFFFSGALGAAVAHYLKNSVGVKEESRRERESDH